MSTKEQTSDELKQLVKEKYNKISEQPLNFNASSCCGSGEASDKVYNIMTDDYSSVEGYNKDADLDSDVDCPPSSPASMMAIQSLTWAPAPATTVLWRGTRPARTAKCSACDFAESMIAKARKNAEKLGYNNVEFRHGDIEDMPVSKDLADVIVSNCVLNLVPNKQKVFSEIFRVLKPGGHFSISDIVLVGDLPEALREDAEMYAGCVAGAIQKQEYLGYIEDCGFENITIQKEKPIVIPDEILKKYLSGEEIEEFNNGSTGIYSITVFAQKPGTEENSFGEIEMLGEQQPGTACTPGSGCC
ncbi:MAG: methyltransferase domain-containing protein [Balneolaceae bacterium]|nr:methyltransferase domain-containing protein [Balneolaceae bacterium]